MVCKLIKETDDQFFPSFDLISEKFCFVPTPDDKIWPILQKSRKNRFEILWVSA